MKNKPARGRKTIGVLIDWTVESYQHTFLSGIMNLSKSRGVNCIVFEGGGVGSPFEYETQRNGIYRLASGKVVDGLIVLSASIAHFIGPEEARAFCENYQPLPLVSISMEIENTISVLVDNRPGMRELLTHLIERHHFRKFGFIKGRAGNQDAEDRVNVFLEVLRERNIHVSPRCVYPGDFTFNSGIEAARYFLKKGISDVDVIVASNDNMAMGLMQELGRRGVRIPEQVAVTGFDDIDFGDYLFPPLSTVRLPIYEQGVTAARLLIDRLEHKEVPSKVYVPTRMVIRESCGCHTGYPAPQESAEGGRRMHPVPALREKEDTLPYLRQVTQLLIADRSELNPDEVARKLDQALGKKPAGGDPSAMTSAFHEAVYEPLNTSIDFFTYRNMLGKLWSNRSLSIRDHPTEAAIQDQLFAAIADLGQKVVERESQRLNELLQESQKLEVIRELLFTMDLDRQMDVLARRIPDMGIESCYVALFRNPMEGSALQSDCILAVRGKERVDLGLRTREFPSDRLVPDDFLTGHENRMVIVEAMKGFGFIVFEMGEKPNLFFAYLSDIISGSVQGAVLYKALENQKNDLDSNLTHMRKAMAGFIQTMSATVETRDPYTAGHQRRVSDLARTIAQEMGLPAAQVEAVRMAGIIHDLGKIYIPAEILNRAGVLDEIEWSMIQRHPKVAWDVLKNIDFPWPIAEIVYQHHERLNGKGYPNKLRGDAICLEARILAVADVVEAMSSHRPYREALGIEKALEEINKNKNTLYDPKVVEVCTELFRSKGYKFRTTDYLGKASRKS